MLITDYGASGLLPPLVLLAALLIDAIVGEFGPLFRVLPHPVAMIGAATGWVDRRLNRDRRAAGARAFRGAMVALGFAVAMAALGWALADISRRIPFGWVIELLCVVLFLAQRSLFDHVRAVARALDADGLVGGRAAVARIVGRDPEQLDTHGVARAAIESLAESFSDAVVAPAFWYLLFGLPGLFVYKTINTMDSMIGYRTERHAAFGAATARLDDALNYAPARLAGIYIVVAAMFTPKGLSSQALKVMARDGKKHRSPNAGWPEAAMAGALSVALSGPRRYDGKTVDEPWLGEEFSARIGVAEIRRALYLFVVACLINAAVIAAIVTYLIA
ncbi:MAG: adenosylcobinamide-phosphate synthase CbiB [Proteobacteria bacterium]|nr:adenosylcobinamide-phosphate synthase CbiB [Pseudomonadota bacterium]